MLLTLFLFAGKFYRHKTPFHAHTNAAKAALNMITRTSAQDYVLDRIFMNASVSSHQSLGSISAFLPHERLC